MTIISHKYKFIFLKPAKVAGTSISQALGGCCGPNDIVTTALQWDKSNEGYPVHAKNEGIGLGWPPHLSISEIIRRLCAAYGNDKAEKIWKNYKKITVVRNPWDKAVSHFCWETRNYIEFQNMNDTFFSKHGLSVEFRRNIHKFAGTNDKYYFYLDNKFPWRCDRNLIDKAAADFYIRFESIEDDLLYICDDLNIPIDKVLPLPKMKYGFNKFNKNIRKNKQYHIFYNSDLRDLVGKLEKRVIKKFKYKFIKD
jgi:hypothetical protein